MPDITLIIDIVFKYGATGVLLIWVWFNRQDMKITKKEVHETRTELKQANDEHKTDLKNHANEMKALVQGLSNKL